MYRIIWTMVLFLTVMTLLSPLCNCVLTHDVSVIKRNVLTRRKRYLTFPKGSNFVIQLSAIKSIQQIQPVPWNFLGELEFPFPLPEEPSIFKRKNRVTRDRREVYTTIKESLRREGYNGKACLRKMICETNYLKYIQGKSMVNDIIHAIFNYCETNFDYKVCDENLTETCSLSILGLLLKPNVEDKT